MYEINPKLSEIDSISDENYRSELQPQSLMDLLSVCFELISIQNRFPYSI